MEGEENSLSQMDDPSMNKRAKLDASDSDRLLNFATAADEFELSLKRQKIPRDPMSHRIIEKRRRDRMNNCLADLSRLIPASYHKQGQGRIEKTEIIEMAIKHINIFQQRVDELEKKVMSLDKGQGQAPVQQVPVPTPTPVMPDGSNNKFYLGFREAQDEVMRFLVEVESINTMDPFCKKIMKHLENASQKFVKEIAHYPPPPIIVVDKTDSSPLDTERSNQSPMFHHSAFYPATGGPPVPEEGSLGMDPKRDDRLRTLLGDQQNSMVWKVMAGNNTEAADERRGVVPSFSYSSHLSGVGSVVGSSGYISDMSNLDKNSPNGSISSRENVYKFKHNITKRFSQEGRHLQRYSHHHQHMQHHQPSDTSSNTSSRDLEDDQGQLRWKGGGKHKICRMYTDDMGTENVSPNSDECNSGSNSSDATRCPLGSSVKGRQTADTSIEEQVRSQSVPTSTSSSVALPGFILHPSGTHYMPISVHNTNISGLFESGADQEGMPVFHPISIPVHFRRPVISMPNITICTHLNSKHKDQNNKE